MDTPRAQSMVGPRAEPAPTAPPVSSPRGAPADRVNVSVGRLILDGFDLPPGSAGQVRAAFQRELMRLLASGELPSGMRAGGARRRLPGGPLDVGAWTDPADLGSRIARAIHEGMKR